MKISGLNTATDLSKAEEIKILETLHKAFLGSGNYLEKLFSRNFIDWASYQIRDDIFPELILINAHNAGSCFELRFGIYRRACSNGMVVADAEFGSYKVRHMGFNQDDILDASFKVIESAPKIIEDINELKSINLIEPAREFYAARAAKVRWGAADPVRVHGLLGARRSEDQKPDLFTTFNIIQENIIQGGVEGRSLSGRKIRTQAIRSIDRDIATNTKLWEETRRMAEMVKLGRTRWPKIMD